MSTSEPSSAGGPRADGRQAGSDAAEQTAITDEPGSAAWLARTSAELLSEDGETPTVERIVERAVEVVPGCDLGGISLRRGRRAETPASTHPDAQHVDDLQYEIGEGPCLDAIWVDDHFLIPDVQEETRWPRWVKGTLDRGVRSVLSVRIETTDETLGCLNLYSRTPHAFDAEAVDLAQAYASFAASALSSSRKITHLQKALDTRHRIGLAQGILMAQFKLSEAASFELLRRYSQEQNVKLRDVAARLVESHLGQGRQPSPSQRPRSTGPDGVDAASGRGRS